MASPRPPLFLVHPHAGGSMVSGSVAYARREGRLLERFGPLPLFCALTVYGEHGIDTVAFDEIRDQFRYTPQEIYQFELAWLMVRQAVRRRNLELMARASTLSARNNQRLLPKPLFADMLRLVELGIGDGLMAAHSGSALALVLDRNHPPTTNGAGTVRFDTWKVWESVNGSKS